MPDILLSANMGLPVPVVGVESGPQFASDINSCMTLIDAHNHAPGSGIQIDPTGININANLEMNSNNLIGIRTLRLVSQSAPLALPTDLSCVYSVSGDLYFNDGLGNQVRLTQSGSIVGTAGSITGLVSPATASYVAANSTFVWQSGTNIPASLDAGSVIFRKISASSPGITVRPPTAIASDYEIVWPPLPGANSFMAIDSSGNMSAPYPLAAGIPLAALVTAVQNALVPAGSVIMTGATSAPSGFLFCDGSAVSRTTYSALFTAVGTAFGSGNGTTTFNVPDMRGRFPRGTDLGAGRDPDAAARTAMNSGGNTGNNVGSVQASAFSAHSHALYGANAPAGGSQPALIAGATGISLRTNPSPDNLVTAMGNTGEGTETRPINAYLNFIIKT